MNWIMTCVFIAVMFTWYFLLGEEIQNKLNFKVVSFDKAIICGFISVFLLNFIIALPLQLLGKSWELYFISISFVYLVITLILVFKKFKLFTSKVDDLNLISIKNILSKHVKEYWFIYLLVTVFSLLSITNQQAYYGLNYDDFYYIGKIVNQVDAPNLLRENYFNGNLLNNGSLDIVRIVNTYEIGYAYFAQLFNIYIPFFCRVTMVIHNYLIIFITFKCLAQEYVKKQYSQFVLIPFILLLISAGYAKDVLNIKMYDAWQFQTAIFYGGSIVRVLSIPVIIIFSMDLLEKFNINKFVFLVCIYFFFISFSTIFIQIAIFMSYSLLVIKSLVLFYQTKNCFKYIYLLVVFLLLSILFVVKKYDTSSLNNELAMYSLHLNNERNYMGDIFCLNAYCIFIITYLLLNNKKINMTILIVCFMFSLIFTRKFDEFVLLTALNTFFVPLRTMTSITYMIIFFIGLSIVSFCSRFNKYEYLKLSSIAIITSLLITASIKINLDQIKQYDQLSSGMSRDGYSLNRVLKNDKMIPKMIYEIGEWFNSLDYQNARLLTPLSFPVESSTTFAEVFLMSSNRIEMCIRNGCEDFEENGYNKFVEEFYDNKVNYSNIESVINKFKIQYILIFDENQKEDLLNNNKEIVLSGYSTKDINYYLFKI